MNKKNPRDVRGCPITIRLTKEEVKMAKELRQKNDLNISSFIRNKIKEEYEKRNH